MQQYELSICHWCSETHSGPLKPISFMRAIEDVAGELVYAWNKFPARYTSPHEGFAILQEEVDELWNAIKNAQKPRLFGTRRECDDALSKVRYEAIQVAAMAVAIVDHIDKGEFGKDAKR